MLFGFLFFFAVHRRYFGSHPILISLAFLSFSTEWERLYFASFVKQWVSFPIFLLVILLVLILEAENRLNIRDCVDLFFYIWLKEREMRQKNSCSVVLLLLICFVCPTAYDISTWITHRILRLICAKLCSSPPTLNSTWSLLSLCWPWIQEIPPLFTTQKPATHPWHLHSETSLYQLKYICWVYLLNLKFVTVIHVYCYNPTLC